MKKFTYIRQTGKVGGEGFAQKVLGSTTSKHTQTECDELLYRQLNTKIASSTNSQPVMVTATTVKKMKKGSKFASSRDACRAMNVSQQALAQAFYRSDKKTVTVNGVTFKKCRSI